MERPKVKAIEDAAEAYVAIRDKRMKLTTQEVIAKAALIEVMRQNEAKLSVDGEGNRIYVYDEEEVILSEKAQVKVKSVNSKDEDED